MTKLTFRSSGLQTSIIPNIGSTRDSVNATISSLNGAPNKGEYAGTIASIASSLQRISSDLARLDDWLKTNIRAYTTFNDERLAEISRINNRALLTRSLIVKRNG